MSQLRTGGGPSAPLVPSSTVATVDLGALAHNVAEVRRRIPSSCQIIAVVKADAYGHGAVPVSRALLRLGVSRLAVATVQEGLTLRAAGLTAPILLLGALAPDQMADAIAGGLVPVLYDGALATDLVGRLRGRAEPYPVHVKVDTGMGRLGLAPGEVLPLLQSDAFKGPLRAEGLLTHLADADSADPAYTVRQLDRFRAVVRSLEAAGLPVPLLHVANSAAILTWPQSHLTAVRPGIMLYGYHTLPGASARPDLRPVLTLSTRIALVRRLETGESVSYNRSFRAARPSRVAVLPIGYADGYSRHLSNRAKVLVRQHEAPVVGRVCMDLTMVDVTDVPGVRAGDEAVLVGRQGDRCITAGDLAAWQGTIPYEVLCTIGRRVARRYVGADEAGPGPSDGDA